MQMGLSVYREELRKIQLKERHFCTELTICCNKDAYLKDTSSLENQQKLLKASCIEVTNMIDELVISLEACAWGKDTRTFDLEE